MHIPWKTYMSETVHRLEGKFHQKYIKGEKWHGTRNLKLFESS